MLIGLVPLSFLAYVSAQLYSEKARKVELMELYSQRIYRSETISDIIEHLQNERKISADFADNPSLADDLAAQREQTDLTIKLLEQSKDPSIHGFTSYTFLNTLPTIRERVDREQATPGEVMNSYTNMVFRLNSIISTFPASHIFLKTVSSELASQKVISEMITYFGIIRSNIYNVLKARQFVSETLLGTQGVYQVYQTYETELRLKASPTTLKTYREIRNSPEFSGTIDFLDTAFINFRIINRYNADQWWETSEKGVAQLRSLQRQTWNTIGKNIQEVLEKEHQARNGTLIFLIIALLLVVLVVFYTILTITGTMEELKIAAGKIANGETGVNLEIPSNDAIGSLADSITRMEEKVRERTTQLIEANTELERSNNDLEQFAYIASHDLQEPVRKIRTFAERIRETTYEQLDENTKKYVDKISTSAERMRNIIIDLLEFSHLSRDVEQFETTDLNNIIHLIEQDLELLITQKNARIVHNNLPVVSAIPVQMNQLFYNLINNALKFSAEGRQPVISITSEKVSKKLVEKIPNALALPDYVELHVADNGIGFSQEYAEQIFTMFQRLSASYEGTGIGLALCKKIVENHKGYIEAEGRPGEGAVFKIILPKKKINVYRK